jgi:hypothetical protein
MERQIIRTLYKSCLRACTKYNTRAAELGRPAVSLLPAPIRDVLLEHQPATTSQRLEATSLLTAVGNAFRAPSHKANSFMRAAPSSADRVDVALKSMQLVSSLHSLPTATLHTTAR